jgi:hypothetical protein
MAEVAVLKKELNLALPSCWEELWLQENTYRRSRNRVFYESCHATSTEEWLPHGIHVSMPRHRSKGWKASANQMATCRLHKDRRVNSRRKLTQNPIHTKDVPKGHISANWRKMGTNRAHRGSVEPTLGRLILAFHVRSLISPWLHSRGAFTDP